MRPFVVARTHTRRARATDRRPADLSAAVYGQVLASSQVAALSLDHALTSAEILVALTGTVLVFWLAHVYARVVADRVQREAPTRGGIVAAMRFEWPVVEAAVPAAVALTLGIVGVLETQTAVYLAISLGAVNLFVWGLAIGRRLKLERRAALGLAVANALFGAVVILMKVAIH
jgi:hypothetical protein